MKNTYKNAVDKIQAPQKSKTKAYNLYDKVNCADNKVNITPIAQVKHTKKKRYSILAASLAFVLSLGAIVGSGFISSNNITPTSSADGSKAPASSPQNSFILTANAAEITHENSASIALNDGGMSYGGGGDEDPTHLYYNTILPIKCEGENIESITYSTDNIAFQLSYLDNNPIIDGAELENYMNAGSHSPMTHEGQTVYTKQYSSITLAYDNQESDNFCIDIVGLADISEDEFNSIFGDLVEPEAVCEVFNKILENTVIDTTITFTDGTTQNEKIGIHFEVKPYQEGPKSGDEPCLVLSLI